METTASEVAAAAVQDFVQPLVNATELILPVVPSGYTIVLTSSDNTAITDEGVITPSTTAAVVGNVTFTVTKTSDSTTAPAVVSVTVPKGVEDTAEAVAASIKAIDAPAKDATQLTLPSVQGYTIVISKANTESTTTQSPVIALDGTITPPAAETTVDVTLKVTKGTDTTGAKETIVIKVVVPAKTPTYAITVTPAATGGTLSVNTTGEQKAGTTITVTMTAPEGKETLA